MTFANPLGLLGFFSLPVIFALHMLRARSQQFMVSSLSLWSFMEVEVRGSRARNIPLTWLLLIHMVVASLFTLAFAQPRLDRLTSTRDARHRIFLLDASTSMRAREGNTTRFAQAQEEIRRSLGGLIPGDIATIITFGSAPRVAGDTREIEFSELLSRLEDLRPGQNGHSISGALALANAVLDPELKPEVHIFTDAAFPEPFNLSPSHPVEWHFIGETRENQAVLDLVATHLSSQKLQVFTRLANFGSDSTTAAATLFVDGNQVDSVQVTLEPESTVPFTWDAFTSLPPKNLTVRLETNDLLQEDNSASTGLGLEKVLQIALVTDTPEPLERALTAAPNTEVHLISPEDYIVGSAFDLVVFRRFLPEEWPRGHIFVLEPPGDQELLPIDSLQNIDPFSIIVHPDPLLADMDLSGVRWTKAWTLDPNHKEVFDPILQSREIPLLLRGQVDSSDIVLLTPDLNSGNLTRHPAFPVLIANLIRMSGDISSPGAIKVGEAIPLPPIGDFPTIFMTTPDGTHTDLSTTREDRYFNITEPGIYELELVDLDGGRQTFSLGVNAGDLDESNIQPQPWSLGMASSTIETQSREMEIPLSLTPWLLGFATLILILEAWIAWR